MEEPKITLFSGDILVPLIEERLSLGQAVRLTVRGNSMHPFLRHEKDTVLLISSSGEKLKKGDIVFYKRLSGQYVLHRIIKADKNNAFFMIGDAQYKIEGPIYIEQIFAKVTHVFRGNKKISCNNFLWRLLSFLWLLLPFRKALNKAKHLLTLKVK